MGHVGQVLASFKLSAPHQKTKTCPTLTRLIARSPERRNKTLQNVHHSMYKTEIQNYIHKREIYVDGGVWGWGGARPSLARQLCPHLHIQ